MFDLLPSWLMYTSLMTMVVGGLVHYRLSTMRKRMGIKALEMTIEQFKDDEDYVAYAKHELEIARNKPFWKF